MSEKKKKAILILLIALIITLFIVIINLCIKYTRKQNETILYYNQRITELNAQLNNY